MRGIWGLVSSNRGVILGGLQIRHDGLNVFFSAFVRRVFFVVCALAFRGVSVLADVGTRILRRARAPRA